MSAYLIATITIHDPEQYQRYIEGFKQSLADFPGEILAAEQKPLVLEGRWPHTRTVVMRFPSKDVAAEWHASPAYQKLATLRYGAATTDLIIVRGLN